MRILVVNAGSSSTKLRLIDGDDVAGRLDLPAIDLGEDGPSGEGGGDLQDGIAALGPADAVGHRIVHGGTDFTGPVEIDDGVVRRLAELSDLAPLHQPRCLTAVRAARRALPDVPHVAAFDTAFHAAIPEAAATYALPVAWRERWPLRRFGFHGLSHAWAARRAAELLDRPAADLRVVTCHLGAGASLAASNGGRSVDTTMGFTPLEGLVMATRSGSVDPGLVLWLQEHGGLAGGEVADGLEHASGLLGLGGTADMREVLAGAARGEAPANLARDVYVHRLRGSIASMAASLGGLDALAFTGGVGEHAPAIRAAAVEGLEFLGVTLDAASNESAGDGGRIDAGGPAAALVIESREDLEIASQVRSSLSARA